MKTTRLSIPFVLAASIAIALGGAGFSLAARAQGQDSDARLAAETHAALSVGVQAPAPAEQAEREAILAALTASAAEWNKGNLDGYMRVYWNSPELTFSSGANTTRGYEAALERYQRTYQAPGREMGQLDYRDVRVDILSADTAFVRGFWHLAQSGGKEPHGVFTLLLRKFPGGWKIVHDHSSGE